MRRASFAAVGIVMAALAACGGDDRRPERTIAFVRTTAITQESQDAFLDELASAGWEVGENLTLLNGDPEAGFDDEDEIVDAVEGFVDDGADLIVALSTTGAMGAARGAREIPITTLTNDPVASGIVSDPRRPAGNVTGVSFRVPADRTIDLARRLVRDDATVGLLYPGDDPGAEPIVAAMADAADGIGVTLVAEAFVGHGEVRGAVDRLVAAGVEVIVLASAPATVRALPAIEEATTAAALPVVGNTPVNEFAVVVLAPDGVAAYRQLGRQAVRLLNGTAVADVPVEDPGSFQLIVRTGVADRLGIDVPDDLVDRADVVEE